MDNSDILIILLFGIIAAAVEILGGYLIISRKEWPKRIQEYLIALGAGFILALVFLELIPESLEHLGISAPIFILLGFATIHFFEHTIVGHLHFGEETHTEIMVSKAASYSALFGILIHAFFDGLAISAGFHFNFFIGVMLFIAVVLHKLPEGLTIATIMIASNQSRKNALLATISIGAATLIGVITVFFLVEISPQIVGVVFALSAGIATYVGASDLIPEINRSAKRTTPLFVFVGMLLFYLSKLIINIFIGNHLH